jgi:hypothetical protein
MGKIRREPVVHAATVQRGYVGRLLGDLAEAREIARFEREAMQRDF